MPISPIARPTEADVRHRLAEIGLDVPAEAVRGTVTNLIVLQDHMETLRTMTLDDRGAAVAEQRP